MAKSPEHNQPCTVDELLIDALVRVPEIRGKLTEMGSVYSLFVQSDLGLRAERRVTLKDMAHAARNDPQALVDYLNGVGGRPVPGKHAEPSHVSPIDPGDTAPYPELDVRELIRDGNDPLGLILEFVDGLDVEAARRGFVLVAPFDPDPLRGLLAGRGWGAQIERVSGDEWRVLFHRDADENKKDPVQAAAPVATAPPSSDYGEAVYMDLRGLEPPQPIVAIITHLEAQPDGASLVAHLVHEPVFLYPELNERGWTWAQVNQDKDDGFQLRVTKPKPNGVRD